MLKQLFSLAWPVSAAFLLASGCGNQPQPQPKPPRVQRVLADVVDDGYTDDAYGERKLEFLEYEDEQPYVPGPPPGPVTSTDLAATDWQIDPSADDAPFEPALGQRTGVDNAQAGLTRADVMEIIREMREQGEPALDAGSTVVHSVGGWASGIQRASCDR